MKTIQIEDYFNKVLFEHTCKNNTLKFTLELAVKEGVKLNYADLANVNLESAYLDNNNFNGNKGYHSFIAYDTSKRTVHCFKHNNTWMVKAGCFWGSLEELETKVLETHKSKVYLMNIEYLKNLT